jgi:hypothetical protein
MNGFIRFLAAAVIAALVVPLAAQQEVPVGRGGTPTAPPGVKIPPLPTAPVRYETGEGQTIRVSVYARGFQNPWSMAFVSDDTILVAERGGAIKAVRNGVLDPKPVPGATGRPRGRTRWSWCCAAGRRRAASRSRGGTRWSWRWAADDTGRGAGDLGRQGVHRHERHLRG